ncbi:MAG TPA: adenylyltransferase/cytidyltransferase family protein, partial [Alphaproteobacteria bacterium]|nr:adenylyltransferase/cytidyltransferase family protein [Alphaproteobacteria bacterium]
MRIIRHPQAVHPELKGGVIAIGNFDGVHLGHQAVIGQAREIAKDMGAPLMVLTFEPHPRSVFQPDRPAFRLTSLRAKAGLMERLGVDGMLVLRFDRALASMEAEDF